MVTALLLAWWLWPSGEPVPAVAENHDASGKLVSSIQPIQQADAASTLVGRIEPQELDADAEQDLKKRFKLANELVHSKETEKAIQVLDGLIADYPGVPEFYANLGALYAQSGRLDLARKTLKDGLEKDRKAKVLFDGLQQVHAALAANAYQKALDATSPELAPDLVELPVLAEVTTLTDQEQTIASLTQQLEHRERSEADASKARQDRVVKLEAEIDAIKRNMESLKAAHQKSLQSQQERFNAQAELLASSQVAEREAKARVVRAEESAATQLADALAKAEQEKLTSLAEKDVVIERQKKEIARARELAAEAVARQSRQSSGQLSQKEKAIDLVKSWARVWSAQNVAAYVDHYAADYSPASSISRSEWLEQRRIRLTNKQFIEVDVSQFSVKDLGDEFSVTFTQHYRSNTVDDIIRKRLVFGKQGQDWGAAKIVSERRVSG